VFRFKQRVWNLSRSDSLCPGCARGCNVHVDQRSGVVYRLLPRDNDEVNECWMCDEGRLTYSRANDARITQPRAAGEEVAAATALETAAGFLTPLVGSGQGLGAAISLFATCEEAYVFGRFARDVLGLERVATLALPDGEADDILRVADKNPNRAGVERVLTDLGLDTSADLVTEIRQGSIKGVLCLGHEGSEPLAEAAGGLEVVVAIAHAGAGVANVAQVCLPSLAWVQLDGVWLSSSSRLQRLRPAFAPEGAARPAHEWIVELADRMGVAFALPSVATVRAEIERTLASFEGSKLTAVGPLGHAFGGESSC
jgi:NADH-quinone oxidoreductase subunit G